MAAVYSKWPPITSSETDKILKLHLYTRVVPHFFRLGEPYTYSIIKMRFRLFTPAWSVIFTKWPPITSSKTHEILKMHLYTR